MAQPENPKQPSSRALAGGSPFATTHWSQVMAAARGPGLRAGGREEAGQGVEAPGAAEAAAAAAAAEALAALCEAYWYPLYAYLRRSGETRERAEDLTQEFFATRVVTGRIFQGIRPEAGRFRSWLLTSLRHLASNQRDRETAAKRGGGQEVESLAMEGAEERYLAESGWGPVAALSPDQLYERNWALRVLELILEEMEREHRSSGKADWFAALRGFLPGEHTAESHSTVAERLGVTPDAVKMAVHRLRQEFGRRLRAEVRRLAGPDGDVEEELRALLAALGSGEGTSR